MTDNTARVTGRSRPTALSDLPKYSLEGRSISTVYVNEFDDNPGMLVAYGEFVRAAKDSGHVVVGGSIRREMSDDDLQKVLLDAQAQWDRMHEFYKQAASGEEIKDYLVNTLKQWCISEGVEVPTALVSAVKA
ncbi:MULTISPECIES: hypothetical protein [unclassified Rhodococcus (in: high G+C Gram-positive bacteria)]|uniref:DUF7432 family protein n=1 Tax=unclassified Rhodococcus (in: high G+C Gram-positive bacteria) TaxID=192944 RepID=UPI0005E1DF0C|nr:MULTISPECIES: hypothetical protein [unclassified Rhodococcus (in: high G+C Gram-positive bacteria)]KJF21925.1 hypothetical protein SZ00_02569 [Rhodococcus sp. AD45]